jgi:hypothetical protein
MGELQGSWGQCTEVGIALTGRGRNDRTTVSRRDTKQMAQLSSDTVRLGCSMAESAQPIKLSVN